MAALSQPQKRELLKHMKEGPQMIFAGDPTNLTRRSLVEQRLLCFDGLKTARQTFLTNRGRQRVGALLAEAADKLVQEETESA